MTEESAKLRIPYIAASQAQKHVTHNEAMTLLDTLVQLAVLDKDLTAPPSDPEEGDCYIVAASATGAWEGWDKRIARYIDGTWRSYLPGQGGGAGWRAWVIDEAALYVFDGTNWVLFSSGGGGGTPEADVLASGSLPAASVLDITDIDHTLYRTLLLKIAGASHSDGANNRGFGVRISNDNGVSFPTSGYINTAVHIGTPASSTMLVGNIARLVSFVAAVVTVDCYALITGIQDGAFPFASTIFNTSDGQSNQELGVYTGSTDPVDAIRVFTTGGVYDAGTYELIGLK